MAPKKGKSFAGDNEAVIHAIAPLFDAGPLQYPCEGKNKCNDEVIMQLQPKLTEMHRKIPRGNVKWSQYVKAILALMQNGRYAAGAGPVSLKAQLLEAEEQASILRLFDDDDDDDDDDDEDDDDDDM